MGRWRNCWAEGGAALSRTMKRLPQPAGYSSFIRAVALNFPYCTRPFFIDLRLSATSRFPSYSTVEFRSAANAAAEFLCARKKLRKGNVCMGAVELTRTDLPARLAQPP